MIQEHDVVRVIKDLPEDDLKSGDTGTVVAIYKNSDFLVEFENCKLIILMPEEVEIVWKKGITP